MAGEISGVAASPRGKARVAPTIKLTSSMIHYLLIKLGVICPKCGEKYWTFTYGKPRKCGYTVTPTTITEAPGSPYEITNPNALVVVPK
jgi:hypothetical protein